MKYLKSVLGVPVRNCYHYHHREVGGEGGQDGYECVNVFKLQYMKFPEN